MILSILSLIHSNNLINAERYRSGHNEAVLKTVCPQGRVGSNPTLSARQANKNLQKKVKIMLDKTKKMLYNK